MTRRALPLVLLASTFALAQASPSTSTSPTSPPAQQQPTQQRRGDGRQGTGFRGVGGEIQSINGDTITVTTREGGTATIKTSSDTRYMKDGQAAKLSDFKAGDRIIVRGESAGQNAWKAEMVGTGRMGMMGGGQGGPGGGMNMERLREGLGKEFIAGQVKSIDGTKLTVTGPDGKDYVAEVDENTSFRKGRESITFPDFKVGDRVMGRGKLNSQGVFVPEVLNLGGFGGGGDRGSQQAPAPPKL